MATNEGKKAFLSTAMMAAYLVVMLNADNTVSPHDGVATKNAIGFTDKKQLDDHCNVILRNSPGSREVTAAGVIAINAPVFAAADGEIQTLPAAAADYLQVGVAIEAATAAGDIIEIIPCDPVVVTVS